MGAASRVLATVSSAWIAGGCSSHAYYNEAMLYMEQTQKLLIEEGLCRDVADCSRKEMALWSAGGWKIGSFTAGGVSIEVYKVSDAAIARKIVDRCKTLHSKTPSVPVAVTIYSNAHIDNLHPGTPNVVLSAEIS
jgi:hypothetical protein